MNKKGIQIFSWWKRFFFFFASLPTDCAKSSVKYCGLWRLAVGPGNLWPILHQQEASDCGRKSDWSTLMLLDRRFIQLPLKFWLPCTNACYELFARRIREINKASRSVNSLHTDISEDGVCSEWVGVEVSRKCFQPLILVAAAPIMRFSLYTQDGVEVFLKAHRIDFKETLPNQKSLWCTNVWNRVLFLFPTFFLFSFSFKGIFVTDFSRPSEIHKNSLDSAGLTTREKIKKTVSVKQKYRTSLSFSTNLPLPLLFGPFLSLVIPPFLQLFSVLAVSAIPAGGHWESGGWKKVAAAVAAGVSV